MKREKNEIILAEKVDAVRYPSKNMEKYKELIGLYKSKDDDIGRSAITARELSELTTESYEMFRKILNGQKRTTQRDYIIMIGILLQMDSNVISLLLSYYGMEMLNPRYNDRDSELACIADEAAENENPDARLTMDEINKKLIAAGFPCLRIKNSEEEPAKISNYSVEKNVTYTSGDYETFDQYDSIATRYDFHRYRFISKMLVKNKLSGQVYELTADDKGDYSREEHPWPEDGRSPFTVYKSLEDTGEFLDFFQEMLREIRTEKRRIEGIIHDTKNYGERIGAGILNRKFHVYAESYNYDIPERDEYYLIQFVDGEYKLYIFNESVFMRMHLGREVYKEHYKIKKFRPLETYISEAEIRNRLAEKKCSFEQEILLRSRLRYFLKLQKSVSECFEKIKSGKAFVLNLDYIFDVERDRVCAYFNIEKEYECYVDDMGMFFAGCSEHVFACEFGDVNITLNDLYRAFELGFENIEDICYIKYKNGSIDSVLCTGTEQVPNNL